MKLETLLNAGLLLALLAALTYPVAALLADDGAASTDGPALTAQTGSSRNLRIAEQITSAGLVSGALFLIARKVACGT